MEREKWYLKSKLKLESNTIAGGLSARPVMTARQNMMGELQKECQILRERVKELSDRLENEDNEQLLLQIEEQRRRISALESVSQVCCFSHPSSFKSFRSLSVSFSYLIFIDTL